jgi:hypothetical protein
MVACLPSKGKSLNSNPKITRQTEPCTFFNLQGKSNANHISTRENTEVKMSQINFTKLQNHTKKSKKNPYKIIFFEIFM